MRDNVHIKGKQYSMLSLKNYLMKHRRCLYPQFFLLGNYQPGERLLALSVGVFGKIRWDGEKYVGNDPTTTDILGPFYRPGAPFKTDLVQAGTKARYFISAGRFSAKMVKR